MSEESFEAIGRNFGVALALQAALVLGSVTHVKSLSTNDSFVNVVGWIGLTGLAALAFGLQCKATLRLATRIDAVICDEVHGPFGHF